MSRRRLVILCHWASFLLLAVLLIKGRASPGWLTAGFGGLVALWVASYLVGRGPLARPGPKLTGWLRTVHRAQHHALYAAISIAAGLVTWQLEATSTGRALKVLLFAGLLHGLFHMWRHTALYDGALRSITPRALHKLL